MINETFEYKGAYSHNYLSISGSARLLLETKVAKERKRKRKRRISMQTSTSASLNIFVLSFYKFFHKQASYVPKMSSAVINGHKTKRWLEYVLKRLLWLLNDLVDYKNTLIVWLLFTIMILTKEDKKKADNLFPIDYRLSLNWDKSKRPLMIFVLLT